MHNNKTCTCLPRKKSASTESHSRLRPFSRQQTSVLGSIHIFNPTDQNIFGQSIRVRNCFVSRCLVFSFCLGASKATSLPAACHPERMRKIFLTYGVEILFHAAAYKHVPVMEANVEEAVSNNVFGLLALLNVAQDSNCAAFVMISSDKAVNPTNGMGCTKRIGELILAAWPGERMRCVSVRFGNVLGSNGSVIPLFQEQIRQNQPVTITHPEMTRFFMTITEAVSLVLQAFAVGRSGDIMVLDMGEPVRVADLAKTLLRLSGKSTQEFTFIGLRPGEKLFEELFYPEEHVLPRACAKIARTESAKLAWPSLKRGLDELLVAVSLGKRSSILASLRQIVPQFTYAGSNHVEANQTASEAVNRSETIPLEVPPLLNTPRSPYRGLRGESSSGPTPKLSSRPSMGQAND